MRLVLLVVISVALCSNFSLAQSTVQYSAPFDEPTAGWNKVMQLSNGNTFLFNFSKDGIDVTVYGKNKTITAKKTLKSEVWEPRKMKTGTIEGIYEIAGQPVIFLQQMLSRTPILFRIVLDANTGAIVNEQQISELKKYGFGAGYAMAFGGVDPADFYVKKDPSSDCYAIINFNSFAGESDERIEVVHFNGKHKELNRAHYDAQGFKYLRFVGMTVESDKSVFLCAYGFNTAASGGKDSRVIVSRLNSNEKAIKHNPLEFTDDFKNTRAVMQYNPGTGLIQLMTLTNRNSKNNVLTGRSTNYFSLLMCTIDPATLAITSVKPLTTAKADAYVKTNLKNPKGYTGLPQQMIINKDKTTTVLLEEMLLETINNKGAISYRTYLSDIGVAKFDAEGNEISGGYAVNKSQMANGRIDPLYISEKSNGYWSLRANIPQGLGFGGVINNNAFLSYDYVNTGLNEYIFYNDYPENLERKESKKTKTVVHISDANTIACKVNGDKVDKFYLFGSPEDDSRTRFCYIESSHFLKENNTYATLMMDKDGRKKQAKVAWVTLK